MNPFEQIHKKYFQPRPITDFIGWTDNLGIYYVYDKNYGTIDMYGYIESINEFGTLQVCPINVRFKDVI